MIEEKTLEENSHRDVGKEGTMTKSKEKEFSPFLRPLFLPLFLNLFFVVAVAGF